MTRVFLPPARIGVIGGGQLGMMLIREAHRMGYRSVVWDPDPDCPAGRLADGLIAAPFSDEQAAEQLMQQADVITYEFENVNADIVQRIEREKPLFPGSSILRIAQHRQREKEELSARSFPVVPYRILDGANDAEGHLDKLNFPIVVKTVTSGYDGKGQSVIPDKRSARAFLESAINTVHYVAEEFLDLQCEISVLVVRSQDGAITTFPVAENLHRENILHITRVPARIPETLAREAQEVGKAIAESFGLVGLLCVEMFVTKNGTLLVNELAPRPHNSGHYSLDASSLSQYEALLRTMCGLFVPTPRLLVPCAMINILGRHMLTMDVKRLSELPGVKLHLYGKTRVEPRRKMGHITMTAERRESVEALIRKVTELIGEPLTEHQPKGMLT